MELAHSYSPRNTIYLAQEIQQAITPDALNIYGGWTEVTFPATGYFRVEKINGVWRMIDPLGNPFISKGLNSVKPDNTTLGEQKMLEFFGTRANWATAAASQLKGLSFNTLGAWSDHVSVSTPAHPIPYTNVLYMAGGYGMSVGKAFQGTGHIDFTDDLIPVFDPGFATYCTQAAAALAAEAQNSWLIGRFSDNELPFPADALDRWLVRPVSDPGRVAALNWLSSQQLTPAAINDTVRAAFLEYMAETYFRTCKEAIKAVDPNHLYLGSRFHSTVKSSAPVLRAAGRHVDVISINLYARWQPSVADMDNWEAWANRPFIITEFYAKGMDSGLTNSSGAGYIVETQRDRGLFYHNISLSILKHRGCVGWHWFRYIDNNETDTAPDPTNANSNKGIVNINYQPYTALTDLMKLLNQRAYRLREDLTLSIGGGDTDGDGMNDSWETTYFGGKSISNGTADRDGDGFTDQQEHRCGTNPTDSKSLLKIASTHTISKTEMVMNFNAVAGKTYKLLASPDLTTSSWQTIRTGIIGVSPTTSVTVPIDQKASFFIIGVE